MVRRWGTIPCNGPDAQVKAMFGQSLRFGAVGIINTVVGLSTIYGLMFFFDVTPFLANASGYIVGLMLGFLLNRTWTFRSDRPIGVVLPRYVLVVVLSYAVNLAVLSTFIAHFNVSPYAAQLSGVVVYTVLMFFGCRLFVFSAHTAD